MLKKLILMYNLISNTFSIDGNSAQITLSDMKFQEFFFKRLQILPSGIYQGQVFLTIPCYYWGHY